jgi:hypothetical protein
MPTHYVNWRWSPGHQPASDSSRTPVIAGRPRRVLQSDSQLNAAVCQLHDYGAALERDWLLTPISNSPPFKVPPAAARAETAPLPHYRGALRHPQ